MKRSNQDLLEIANFTNDEPMLIINSEFTKRIEIYLSSFKPHQMFELFCVLEFLTHKQKHLASINDIYRVFTAYYLYIQSNFDQFNLGAVALMYKVNTSVDRLNLGRRLTM